MVSFEEVSRFKVDKAVQLSLQNGVCTVKGKLGSVTKTFRSNYVKVEADGDSVVVSVSRKNKSTRAIAGTWESLIKGMINGVTNGYQYEMKIDYTHFPMRVSVKGNEVVVENFLGERSPRKAKILGSCSVSIKGDRITISGVDREEIGNTASNIERATKIKGFDLRVFQDGIYLLGGN